MAKLRSGILGNTRGKVAGVVGSQWKNVNYIREYVKPANPQTAAQVVQRTKMTDTVAFCKTLVGPVFNTYLDKFLKGMSAYNNFIKQNIAEFDGSPDYTNVQLTFGKLYPLSTFTGTYDTGDGSLVLTWGVGVGNNGSATDKVFWVIYDSGDGKWFFSDGEVARSAAGDTQTLAGGRTATELYAYAFTIKYTGTIIDLVSVSLVDQLAAP